MFIITVILPLLSFITISLVGRKIGEKGSSFFSIILITTSFFIAILIALNDQTTTITLFKWVYSKDLDLSLGLLFDTPSKVMLIVITSISSLVHWYSFYYMEGDPHVPRFMSYLSLFTFFMIILVTSNNYLQLFIGWEGVGVMSYFLINFWSSGISANKSAIKAMILNRVGDAALLLATFSILYNVGSLTFSVVFNSTEYLNTDIIGALLLIGAVGKSAQLGLHSWLPDAMAGPTPVSALIHAATMVTAGIFLIIRSSPILEASSLSINLIIIVGGITTLFASIIGAFQNDLKRIIAFSTCSQLGFMLIVCGYSQYTSSLNHLLNHAFFKALLFLAAGSVIFSFNTQDIRRMGANTNIKSYTAILIGSMSLMGLPYLSGFYSKDIIMEFGTESIILYFTFWSLNLAVFFTSYYSTRLFFYTFIINPNTAFNYKSSNLGVTSVLSLLSIGAVFSGYISSSFFYSYPNIGYELEPLILIILGFLLAIIICKYPNLYKISLWRKVYSFLNSSWRWDYVQNLSIVFLSFKLYKVLEKGLLEPPYKIFIKISQWITISQSGFMIKIITIIIFSTIFLLITL